MIVLQLLGLLLLALVITAVAVRLLNPLPPLEPRHHSTALTDTLDTPLGRGTRLAVADQPGLSGLHLLNDGREAFAARILLARAATRSLDIQYYIWHGDLSGTLMLEAMREAADRGVRVRMLLDDNGITGLDAPLAALDLHPNIEIRLFNPFLLRRPKMVGYLADFPRLNRRMHNKSFTADNQATIVGGRNIGDDYFGARDHGLFADLDVLAVGRVVRDVSNEFDRYWSSASAYPAATILPEVQPERRAEISAMASIVERDPRARAYVDAVRSLPFVEQMVDGTLRFEWTPVRLVSDDPAKAIGRAKPDGMLTTALREIVGRPSREVGLISGYFVPTMAGTGIFSELARNGIRVSILTNAFEATDVWVVHAGYANRRTALLKAGVRLYEVRGPARSGEAARRRRKLLATGSGSSSGSSKVLRSSETTLHAKTFTVDRQRLFIGSFNFDPRSMHLNTELGFVIESPVLASRVQDAFETVIPQQAYEVRLSDDAKMVWLERRGDGVIRHEEEPGTTRFQRTGIAILSNLPIEWLL